MSMTNIGRDDRDMNYRYKMPVLTTKVEGRGNGIKTVITNMVDIAKALHIHPAYPTKFFGIELGAQSKFNVATERAIVNGCHQAPDLSKILDKFIQGFILCPNCKLPELKMVIKSTSIKIECAACGHASQIKSAHRLVGYMLKNPPKTFSADGGGDKPKKSKDGKKKSKDDDDEELDEASSSVVAAASQGGANADAAAEEADGAEETEEERKARKAAKKAKKEKKEKKAKKEGKEKKEKKEKKAKKEKAEKESESESSDDEEETKESDKAAAAAAPAASASPKPTGDDEDEDDDGDDGSDDGESGDDWHTDTSKAAQRSRQDAEFKEMMGGATQDVENIMLSAKAGNKQDSPVTILKIFLASKPRRPAEVAAELRRLAMSRGLDEPQKLKILLESIIDISNPKLALEQFKSNAELLRYFVTTASPNVVDDATGSSIKSANMLLTCVEDLIGVVERKLLPAAPMILKTLYDEDVLDEAVLIAWFDAPPESSWLVNKDVAAEVRSKATPFIEWLKTAESDEEEDDE